jgi:hypothetical protein
MNAFGTFYFEVTPWAPLKVGGLLQRGRRARPARIARGSLVGPRALRADSTSAGRQHQPQLTRSSVLHRDGGTAFDPRVVDGRLSWQFDPRQRVRVSVQASDVTHDPLLYTVPVRRHDRDVAAQLLYSYKLNPRSALYAGYSQGGVFGRPVRDILPIRAACSSTFVCVAARGVTLRRYARLANAA